MTTILDGRYAIECVGHTWLAQVSWILPGESMIGSSFPHWACFSGSRRRCKRWVENMRRQIRKVLA